jgi:5-methylthioadenosine/S-adenosylhomocysteine deaminase
LKNADILIHGCTILPMNRKRSIENGALAVKDGRIAFVGKNASAGRIVAEAKIDAKGKVALPGLINCHTHVPMTVFRGIADDKPLNVWLEKTIWPLEARLKPEDIYNGALLGCLEMIEGGTTCFADMYFHEDEVAKAVEKSGLRGVLGEGVIEAGSSVQGEKMLARSVSFAERFRDYADGRVSAMLAPHAVYSCSPELLLKVGEEASRLGVGLHLHLGESETMLREFEKRNRSSEVEFLNKIGLLNERVLAAHCIDLSEKDMRTLSNRKVNAAYVPIANMKLGLSAAKVKDLTSLGVNVGLGTDGPASNNSLDLFETMKTGALLQKHEYLNPTVLPAYEVLKMATLNGARAVGLEKDVGSLEVGKKADIILVDLAKPHLTPLHDIYSTIVYSARAADVETVIVDGKILMQNQQARSLDEQAVMEKARKTAYDLLSR